MAEQPQRVEVEQPQHPQHPQHPHEPLVDLDIENFLCSLGVDAFWDSCGYGSASHSEAHEDAHEDANAQEGHCTFIIRFHGASDSDPGPCGAAYVIYKREQHRRHKVCAGKRKVSLWSSALEAQYFGMIFGLERALDLSARRVEIEGISSVVLDQMQGSMPVDDHKCKPLHMRAHDLIARLENVEFKQVSDEDMIEAIQLTGEAVRESLEQARQSPLMSNKCPPKKRRVSEAEKQVAKRSRS